MRKKQMRRLASALALTMAAGLFTGCGSPAPKESESASAETEKTEAGESQEAGKTEDSSAAAKDTLIIATANEAPNMTTNLHNATAGEYLNLMTHDRLFYSSEDLTPKPSLCESYEIVSDTEWLFHLRKDVKFHNGQEMKAEDVKASLELCKESPQVSQYGQSTGTIEVVDDYTVKITSPDFFMICVIMGTRSFRQS